MLQEELELPLEQEVEWQEPEQVERVQVHKDRSQDTELLHNSLDQDSLELVRNYHLLFTYLKVVSPPGVCYNGPTTEGLLTVVSLTTGVC